MEDPEHSPRALVASRWVNETSPGERQDRESSESWSLRYRLPAPHAVDTERLTQTLADQDWSLVQHDERKLVFEHSAYWPTMGLKVNVTLQDQAIVNSPTTLPGSTRLLFGIVAIALLYLGASMILAGHGWLGLFAWVGTMVLGFLALAHGDLDRFSEGMSGVGPARLEFVVVNGEWVVRTEFPRVNRADFGPIEKRLQRELDPFVVEEGTQAAPARLRGE